MALSEMYPLITSFLFMNLLSYIPWTLIFLVTPYLFGIRLYFLQKREECSRIQKRVQDRCSHTTDGGKGYGYALGRWYAMNINVQSSEYGDTYSIYIIATQNSFRALTQDAEELATSYTEGVEVAQNTKLTIIDRRGSYANPWFYKREREANDTPMGQQASVVKALIEHQKKRRHTVAYIHGPPGTGKSMIGLLVANEMEGAMCNTLRPWQPGDMLSGLVTEAEPTPSKPLIIMMDEVDSVLVKINEGIPLHKNIPIATPDKQGWNHMLDEIQRGMYPDVMLIMTGNSTPDTIKAIDPSYIRAGRVDLIFEMTESLIEE